MDIDSSPLALFLDLAVPMALMDLHAKGGPTPSDIEDARAYGDVLSERGDILLFGGKIKKGEEGPGALAARLARAVAVMAYVPGGVRVFGRHWVAGGDGASQNGQEGPG